MSGLRLQLKKAIPIVVVTWILSMATTLVLVYFAPSILPRTWHEVARFEHELEDYGTKTANLFHVPSNRWKTRWTVIANGLSVPEDISFELNLLSEGAEPCTLCRVTPADFEWNSYWNGAKYITGSGKFSMKVAGENVLCRIVVEAYY